jgi:hypothetical protein
MRTGCGLRLEDGRDFFCLRRRSSPKLGLEALCVGTALGEAGAEEAPACMRSLSEGLTVFGAELASDAFTWAAGEGFPVSTWDWSGFAVGTAFGETGAEEAPACMRSLSEGLTVFGAEAGSDSFTWDRSVRGLWKATHSGMGEERPERALCAILVLDSGMSGSFS